jgi:hypothetical protein
MFGFRILRSVDAIVASFQKTLDELKDCIDHNLTLASEYSEKVLEFEQKCATCNREAERAKKVAENLTNLIDA